MRDTKIQSYMTIANAIKNPIWNLCCQNAKYGTGFGLWRTGDKQITLELMDDCSDCGAVVDSIVLDFDVKVNSPNCLDFKWVNDVVNLFESQLFERQAF